MGICCQQLHRSRTTENMDQASLIALLNDIAHEGSRPAAVYFDPQGQPTDRFLEALKDDIGKLADFPDDKIIFKSQSNIPHENQEILTNNPASTSSYVNSVRRQRVEKHIDVPQCDDITQSSESTLSSASVTGNARINPDGRRRSHHSSLVPSKEPKKASKSVHSTKAIKHDPSLHKKHYPKMSLFQKAALTSNKSICADISSARTETEDLEQVLIEKDSKIKSLQLRLSGQLQSIKSMENQLLEAQSLIDAKSKQIAALSSKLRITNEALQKQVHVPKNDSKGVIETIDLLKKQIATITAKLSDETTKRHKAEERSKMLKDCADAARLRCGTIESQNGELQAAIIELQNKLGKYRKSYRDVASDVNTHRNALSQKDLEISRWQKRAEQLEEGFAKLRCELEKCGVELKGLRKDNKHKADIIRDLQLQQEIQQERELVKRVESRLAVKSISNVNDSKINPYSPSGTRTIQREHTPYGIKSGGLPPPPPMTTSKMQWIPSASIGQLFENNKKSADDVLDMEIVQENLNFALDGSVQPFKTKNDASSPSSETIQRLRALAERDAASLIDTHSETECGSLRSTSKADRLQQIYMKVSNRSGPITSDCDKYL